MTAQTRQSGFSVVELMVALAVGAIVMAALVTITADTLATTRTQDGMARMQENGRYALSRLRRDIHQMMYMPLTSADASLPVAAAGSVTVGAGAATVLLNSIPRAYESYLANGTNIEGFRPGALDTLREGLGTYRIPANFFVSAHECSGGSCTPDLNTSQAAFPDIPAEGFSAGARMPGTDVITSRVINSNGSRIGDQELNCSAGATGSVAGYPPFGCANGAIALLGNLDPSQPPLNLQNGDPVLIANAKSAVIFAATLVPGGIAAIGGGLNIPGPLVLPAKIGVTEYESRIFNLRENMQSVSYYVRLKEDPNEPNRLVGALVRQTGAGTEELIEGVDQFDLRFGVFGNTGMRYMNADGIYDLDGGTLGCPVAPRGMAALYNDAAAGCLFRNTATVEVSLLVNTIDNLSVSSAEAYRYSAASTLPDPAVALNPAVTPPNGLPTGRMLRREFRETIRIKNTHW